MKFKFEITFENKEFNNEQEITYKVQNLEQTNALEESKYLLKQLEGLCSWSYMYTVHIYIIC